MLGLPFAPPFTDPSMSDPQIFQGVNYASAAAGILDETGKEYVIYDFFFLIEVWFANNACGN